MVEAIRHFAPRVVILPQGRHPDHRIASELGRDACFLSGSTRYPADGAPHRPFKILYALSYREDPIKPTLMVDISAQFERKLAAIRCYASRSTRRAVGEIFPTGQDLYSRIEHQNGLRPRSGPATPSRSPMRRWRWTTSSQLGVQSM